MFADERAIQEIRVKEKVPIPVARKMYASRKPKTPPRGNYSTVVATPPPTRDMATQTCDLQFTTVVVKQSTSTTASRSTKSVSTSSKSSSSSSAVKPQIETRKSKKEHSREDFLRTPTKTSEPTKELHQGSKKSNRGKTLPPPTSQCDDGIPWKPIVSPGASAKDGAADHTHAAAVVTSENMEQDPPVSDTTSCEHSHCGPPPSSG